MGGNGVTSQCVIIGNSVAANSAAARIARLDPEVQVTFVTDEPVPYYSRCALMYYAMDHCAESDIYIADEEYYRRLNARVVHDRVGAVDTEQRVLHLASGDALPYDKLLIASGAQPRRLGVDNEDADGIYDFTTIAETKQVLAGLAHAGRATVIGGGLIGSEAAEVFVSLGVPVDYLVREELFYSIFCGDLQSRIIEERLRHHGVGLHMGRGISHFEKTTAGRVCAVIDSAGDRHETDLVVRAIGVDPRIGFLEGSGTECGAGVLVNEHLATSAPDVWAAGDCAEVRLPGQERTVIQKLWYTAQPQGWVAGDNMAGVDATYQSPPNYQSAMFMDLDFASYGEMPAPWNDFSEENLGAENGVDAIRLVHDGECVVGASVLGTALTKEDAEHMVESAMPLDEAVRLTRTSFGRRVPDRAPTARIARRHRLSRRPYLWPFGREKTWRV